MRAQTDNTERFLVDATGFDKEGLMLCFKWAISYAIENSLEEVALAVATKQQIKHLEVILGAADAKALAKGEVADLGGLKLRRFLQKDLNYLSYDAGPILAIWPRGFLEKVDAIGAPAICAISWSDGDLDAWKENWGPTDLRGGTKTNKLRVSNPVTQVALEHLTATVNLGTGLGHPSDRGSAIGMFRLLRDSGEPYDPSEVRAWAARNGWASEDARELAEIGDKILQRRALRGGEAWAPDAIQRLREEAAAKSTEESH